MEYRRFCCIAVWVIVASLSSYADGLRDSVVIKFRQSKVELDTTYMNNRTALQLIRNRMAYLAHPDSGNVLKEVRVVGGASPEGSIAFNHWLSQERAKSIFRYFSDTYHIPDSLTAFTFLGRNWKGLAHQVRKDPNVPYQEEVLQLVLQIIEDASESEKESSGNLLKLKRLHNGVPYHYMYRHLFPLIRESHIFLAYGRPELQPVKPEPCPYPIPEPVPVCFAMPMPEMPVHLAPLKMEAPRRPFYMALKTNLLFDALAVPNVGFEFYLGKQWSVSTSWMYAWWKNDHRHRYWRIYGGDMAFRKWLGRKAAEKPLTGHHVGVYVQALTYDFEWGGKGMMGGKPGGSLFDKANYGVGAEYGYALPIGRRLNLDFVLGVGYLGGEYQEYIPVEDIYKWKKTKKRCWFGPTKAEVSLVWLLGNGNYNREKGGRR